MSKQRSWFLRYLLFLVVASAQSQETNFSRTELFFEIEEYLYSPDQTKKKSKKYFSEVKILAENDDAQAHYYLGLLQKDGIGTKQSFKKSRKSFKKAFDLGHEKAAYCLGYYYLKGFGDIPQDYQKAYKWFKRSEEPIAKHWMAKMQFLGLGREANKKKALKLLASNELYNSKVLRKQYKEANPPTQLGSTLFKEIITATTVSKLHGLDGLHNPPNLNRLLGDWEGEYVELDWSKNKALRVLPLSLKLTEEEGINQKIGATLQITDSIAAAQGTYSAGKLALAQFNVPIQKQYTDYPNFTHLMTHISAVEFRELALDNETVLVARLTADYPVWQEMANPGFFMLRKKTTVSKEAQQAFDAQAEDFIKLYPNPFEDHLLINFELAETANVAVNISNYYNTAPYQKTVFKGHKTKGNHTLEITDLPFKNGSYLISITHNGKEETKIIVKN